MACASTRRIRLVIEYDGTCYVGWQSQTNGLAIQEVAERCIKAVTGEDAHLHASGRTDSGVHALAQTAHFDTCSRVPADKFAYALNTHLPRDIRVIHSGEAEPDFHARFDVRKKHYAYTILNAPHASAFSRDACLHIHDSLDFEAMREAAAIFTGEHDFAAFKAEGTNPSSTVRRIYESKWSASGSFLRYEIAGSGFLYNMVRILVGTMLDIGRGRLTVASARAALDSGDRSMAGATAPAHGLALTRVEYDGFDTAHYTDTRGGICLR